MRMKLFGLTKGAIVFASALVALAACASNPAADEKIAVAKASLQRAEASGAPEFASVELAAARDKLAGAERANSHRDLQPASDLADQANVDAQLAEATAQEQRSHKAAMEFDASLHALRQESMHSTPATQ